MTDEQFAELLAFALDRNHEQHGLEFKGARPRSDRPFFAKVVRAMLGMANRRDGGTVIIGVDESAGQLVPTGLTPADLRTWRHDDLAADVANYADPPITFDAVERRFEGKSFVVIQVSEFDDVPILCKKPYNYATPRSGGRSEIVEVCETEPATSEVGGNQRRQIYLRKPRCGNYLISLQRNPYSGSSRNSARLGLASRERQHQAILPASTSSLPTCSESRP